MMKKRKAGETGGEPQKGKERSENWGRRRRKETD